jgi:Amiloride-sensitive sodium channel
LVLFCSSSYKDSNTQVDVSYQANFINAFVKQEAINFSDYLASLGGLIGLIAGISVISLVEFCYHLVILLFEKRPTKIEPEALEEVDEALEQVEIETELRVDQTVPEKNAVNQDHALYYCSKYFFEFIKETSVHGLSYTAKKDVKIVGRIFWNLIVVCSTICCVILTKDSLSHAELNPITFGIDEKVWKVEEVKTVEIATNLYFKLIVTCRLSFQRSLTVQMLTWKG